MQICLNTWNIVPTYFDMWRFLSSGLGASVPSFVGLSVCLSVCHNFLQMCRIFYKWITHTQSFIMPMHYLYFNESYVRPYKASSVHMVELKMKSSLTPSCFLGNIRKAAGILWHFFKTRSYRHQYNLTLLTIELLLQLQTIVTNDLRLYRSQFIW